MKEKIQRYIRELTVELCSKEYEELMHWLSEWADYQAECSDWSEEEE